MLWGLILAVRLGAEGPIIAVVHPFPDDPAWRWFCAGLHERVDLRLGPSGYVWREATPKAVGADAQERALARLLGEGRVDAVVLCPESGAEFNRTGRVLKLDRSLIVTFGRPWPESAPGSAWWFGRIESKEAWAWAQTVLYDLMGKPGQGTVRDARSGEDRADWMVSPDSTVDRRPATGAWSLVADDLSGNGLGGGSIVLDAALLYDADRLEQWRAGGPVVATTPHTVAQARLESGSIDAIVMPDYPGLGARAAESLLAKLGDAEEAEHVVDDAPTTEVVQAHPLVLTRGNIDRWRELWRRYAEW